MKKKLYTMFALLCFTAAGAWAESVGKIYTVNADSTVATIEEMPASDLTVDYELVRDMTQSMTVTVEDAQGKSSIRLKKMGNGKYEPADMTPQQMAGLITVTDDIEGKELTNVTDYTVSIYTVDDNDQPTGINGLAHEANEPNGAHEANGANEPNGTNEPNSANGAYYDLGGRKVQTLRQGIYINNGKKVVVK